MNLGQLIKETRRNLKMTQTELAEKVGTQQSAIARLESGAQNMSLEMVNRIASVLKNPLIVPAGSAKMDFRIQGRQELSGSIETRSSKNAAVSLLCASLLNKGRTTLHGIAHIEEVNRLDEVLSSIGVKITWENDGNSMVLERPEKLDLEAMDKTAARRTRSIIMFLGPLLHETPEFSLPYAGGCNLGARTIEPHLQALRYFGLKVETRDQIYHCTVEKKTDESIKMVLTERGDTVTENALMAAALHPGVTTIRNASPNYMVQDLCFFLERCGIQIEGIGTTTLIVHGVSELNTNIEYEISEDPIESMSLLTAAITTHSTLTITRAPIEFLEIELAILGDQMGLNYDLSNEYTSRNGKTRLVDITVQPSDLRASKDKIHPLPFPGLNIDNLPFFTLLSLEAEGSTLIHDWVYENRAIHMLPLKELGANIQLLDQHRLLVTGRTNWHGHQMTCPPALRPAVCLFLAMLAGDSESTLRDVYVINRGYEDLPARLNKLGANIQVEIN